MDLVFNESLSARLQYFTLPLEMIGLALALIEIRFPAAAAFLTQQIERLAMPMEALRSGESRPESLMERSLATLLARILKVGLGVLTLIYGVRGLYGLISRWPELSWLVGFGIGYLISAVALTITLVLIGVTTFFLVVGGTDFAQRFVAGRAVGTLGILIACLGLLGELYQFVTQLVH